jgi:serine/threonine protein kinase
MVEFVRMDAIVAERLTSSPLIYDIYGFCGVSIVSEFFPHGNVEEASLYNDGYIKPEKLHDKDGVDPKNDLEPLEKLEISLQMAEGVATLHGFSGGLIVHNDVQLSQWLYNADESMVKFNDFNRAEFLLWNDEKQEYCKYKNGKGHGNVSTFGKRCHVHK